MNNVTVKIENTLGQSVDAHWNENTDFYEASTLNMQIIEGETYHLIAETPEGKITALPR